MPELIPPPQTHHIYNRSATPGILTQPGAPAPEGSSYIAASYVKWIEVRAEGGWGGGGGGDAGRSEGCRT